MVSQLVAAVIVVLCFASCASVAGETQGRREVTTASFLDALGKAKASSAARQWANAAISWAHVVELNPVNEEYWQQLAEAYYRSGQFSNAIPAFEKVLELGGHCFPAETSYNLARSYALLADKQNALTWLQNAFARGYRDLDHAKNDKSLKILHDDPQFVALVGLPGTAALPRTEGWRRDLVLLQQELERKSYPQFVKMTREELRAEMARLSRDIPNLSDSQATIEIMRIVTKMGVGHSEAWPEYTGAFAKTLPLKLFLFKEGLYVVAAAAKYENLLGGQILKFGDRSADEAIEAVRPIVFRDNEIWVKTFGPYLLRFTEVLKTLNVVPDSSRVALTVRDLAGRTRTVVVDASSDYPNIWNDIPFPNTWVGFSSEHRGPPPLYLRNMQTFYWFEYLPERRTVYFQFNRVLPDSNEPFDQFVRRLFMFISTHDVDKLVIDLRSNNGGNTYLVPPLIHALISTSKINQDGKLFVIIGRRTFSAAENAAAYIQRETNAIFVGEPTGGKPSSLGDETYFNLPYSKLTASVADVYWESSWPQDFRTWVAPQILVEPTFEALNSNRDLALDAILDFVWPGFTIGQHPGFWCKSEQMMDFDEGSGDPTPPATELR
jgi:tetratricopeptide (TPR) repeat protein